MEGSIIPGAGGCATVATQTLYTLRILFIVPEVGYGSCRYHTLSMILWSPKKHYIGIDVRLVKRVSINRIIISTIIIISISHLRQEPAYLLVFSPSFITVDNLNLNKIS